MDRYAILVDAGYVYATGGYLLFDETSRTDLRVNPKNLNKALCLIGADIFPSEYLRTYWYDGAPYKLPTKEQNLIATTEGIEL